MAIGARRQEPLDEARAAVEAAGGDCLALSTDVTSDDDCDRLVAATIEHFGGVDILINNAGQSSSGMIESHDVETWAVDLDLKLYAAIRLAKLCVPSMMRNAAAAESSTCSTSAVRRRAPARCRLPPRVRPGWQ